MYLFFDLKDITFIHLQKKLTLTIRDSFQNKYSFTAK